LRTIHATLIGLAILLPFTAYAQAPEPVPVTEPVPEPEPEPTATAPTKTTEALTTDEDAPTSDEATEGAVDEAEAAVKKKNKCGRICKGDFTVGLGVGYTYFAVKGIDTNYVSVSDKGVLFPENEAPGNRGSGYGVTFTGHFGYTVADNWMIGAEVHYAYQFKTLQAEAFGRYYIKMKQPDTIPFIGLRLGYLWSFGNHNEPVLRNPALDVVQYKDGNEVKPWPEGQPQPTEPQAQVDENGENTVFDSRKNPNGYLGAVELGVVHYFTTNVGVFVTLGYQYVFTGYHKGGGVDIKGGVAFEF